MPFRVLIVDDSPPMRMVVRRLIEVSGFPLDQCLIASDGDTALRLLREDHVDLVLTDVHMPGVSGEQMVEEMRRDSRLCNIPVIVMSSDSTAKRIQTMLDLGAVGYLIKPFYPEMLLHQLELAAGVAHADA
jgi:two-component system chemotaxis response regulator CheY